MDVNFDEVQALVVEIGSAMVKGGFAGFLLSFFFLLSLASFLPLFLVSPFEQVMTRLVLSFLLSLDAHVTKVSLFPPFYFVLSKGLTLLPFFLFSFFLF
jgi:hypothetical protein